MRVPCVMYWPGHIREGAVCEEITASIDFLPMLAALCGGKPGDLPIDGLDISPLLFEDAPSPRDEIFYYCRRSLEGVRIGDWKLHISRNGKPQKLLYNLRENPDEIDNLYEYHPDIVARLSARLDEIRRDYGDAVANVPGGLVRPCARVENPVPLSHPFSPDRPYMAPVYDRYEIG